MALITRKPFPTNSYCMANQSWYLFIYQTTKIGSKQEVLNCIKNHAPLCSSYLLIYQATNKWFTTRSPKLYKKSCTSQFFCGERHITNILFELPKLDSNLIGNDENDIQTAKK